jgi:CRP/FNR family cyclic AMP-dependent transcriptional regulator
VGVARAAHVLEEQPDLAVGLAEADAQRARAVRAAVVRLEAGPWRFDAEELDLRGALGLLVLDGLLLREASILGGVLCTEVLGEGDVLRPWTIDAQEPVSIPAETHWEVLVPGHLAVLDRRFALAVAAWPEVTAAIVDRAVARARDLLFQLSVGHLPGLDVRVLVTLWHLADRWGKVTPRGVVLPLPLTHRAIAAIVGTRRPAVTAAIGRLRERGAVERAPGGAWVLRGAPPAELARAREAARRSVRHDG